MRCPTRRQAPASGPSSRLEEVRAVWLRACEQLPAEAWEWLATTWQCREKNSWRGESVARWMAASFEMVVPAPCVGCAREGHAMLPGAPRSVPYHTQGGGSPQHQGSVVPSRLFCARL